METRGNALILGECREQFRAEGYFILREAVSPEVVAKVKMECDRFVTAFEVETDTEGKPSRGNKAKPRRQLRVESLRDSESIQAERILEIRIQ